MLPCTTLFCQEVDVTPPRFCDFPEELVVNGGIKTLGLHLRATCRERSVAHFWLHFLDFILLCIPTVSAFEKKEIKVGLLFENVLIGCKHFNLSRPFMWRTSRT